MIDALNLQILETIQEQATISNVELATSVKLSPSATHSRMKRLCDDGYIWKYFARLDAALLGFDLLCFIQVRLSTHQKEHVEAFCHTVAGLEQVLELSHITGEYDYLIKVAMRGREQLRQFIIEEITAIPYVATINTNIILEEVKFTTALPLRQLRTDLDIR